MMHGPLHEYHAEAFEEQMTCSCALEHNRRAFMLTCSSHALQLSEKLQNRLRYLLRLLLLYPMSSMSNERAPSKV